MATLTNKVLNTATLTNKEIMQGVADLTWAEAVFTWGQGQGTWGSPWSIRNKVLNTATMTNKALGA